MELRPYAADDLWLTEALECDAVVMQHLGGPVARAEVRRIHDRRVSSATNGEWYFTIHRDEASGPVGTVGIWETQWEGSTIHETGWMILPAYQGQGLASRALDLILTRARADGRFSHIHAFPAIVNAPSNALCRRNGFTLLGECTVSYAGRTLRANHWRLEVSGD